MTSPYLRLHTDCNPSTWMQWVLSLEMSSCIFPMSLSTAAFTPPSPSTTTSFVTITSVQTSTTVQTSTIQPPPLKHQLIQPIPNREIPSDCVTIRPGRPRSPHNPKQKPAQTQPPSITPSNTPSSSRLDTLSPNHPGVNPKPQPVARAAAQITNTEK